MNQSLTTHVADQKNSHISFTTVIIMSSSESDWLYFRYDLKAKQLIALKKEVWNKMAKCWWWWNQISPWFHLCLLRGRKVKCWSVGLLPDTASLWNGSKTNSLRSVSDGGGRKRSLSCLGWRGVDPIWCRLLDGDLSAGPDTPWEVPQVVCPAGVTPSSVRKDVAAHRGDTDTGIYVFAQSGQKRIIIIFEPPTSTT